ncbi:acyltransferase family protein [Periweissella fabalis]|uniref:Acyltransferase n=1 Tax=Periweissella fabalis TaxID=1070421 RepID=A0A7X6N168_9LACO|nr:acyltransferase family protein [Periweissella fabalis]MCM0599085.1 acyltransferase [Periweissella fabalis]NKZ23364.1 acyltransferase [Periweissella fabalis]
MRIKWFSLVRITGLILVLTYHFFQTKFTGGFIGVDVFFTFSGFLITALMVDEFARSTDFKLISFYRRRFYRIVPPLFISVLLVLPLTYLVDHDFVTGIGKQIAAALSFTTNYFEIGTSGSYENKFIPHLFVHTWSLAVEMHFYIIWGLIAFIIAKLSRRYSKSSDISVLVLFRSMLFVVALVFTIGSFLAMYFGAIGLKDFSPVYFSSVTHSFPFFIGCILGILTGIKNHIHAYKWLTNHCNAFLATLIVVLSFAGLVSLGYTMNFDSLNTYQGGMYVASILAGIMILGARLLHDHTPNLNEPRWATFLADVSYSVYLYHWPLYVIFSHMMPNTIAAIVTTIVSIILSALSYYILEPVIAGKPAEAFGRVWTWRQLGLPIIVVAVLLTVNANAVIKAAPQVSSLEQSLLVGGIYQDVDKITNTHDAVLAAAKPKTNNGKADKSIPAGVSIIGDSVTLGTRNYLGAHVANSSIDAEGDRTMNLAYQVMMNQQRSHILREYVVICIGTNALNDYAEQTMKLVNDLAPGHKLIFMTPYNQHATASWNSTKSAVLERQLAKKYDFITIADWDKAAAQHPEIFQGTDGVHFAGRHAGDVLYADVMNQALKAAQNTPAK